MLKFFITFLFSCLLLAGCLGRKNCAPHCESSPPIISAFKAEPASVNEGEAVGLTVQGSEIERCVLFANGEEIIASLNLAGSSAHIPTEDTEYRVSCSGPGGETTAKALVNIIIADDIIKADTLAEISKHFDVSSIKNLALEKLGEGTIKDFDPTYQDGTVSLSKHSPESISTKEVNFDREHAVLYGYEGNHDFESYKRQCEASFDASYNPLYQKARFSTEILEKSTVEREYVIPNEYHVINFEAVTHSLENPIHAQTEWDVSFGLAQTKISYSESFRDYGEAKGFFRLDGKVVTPVDLDNNSDIQSLELDIEASFPEGYPVPPSTDKYPYDPTHDTCNTSVPVVRYYMTYQNENELCSSVDAPLACDPGFGSLPTKWPVKVERTYNGKSIDQYIERFGSERIYRGNALLKCSNLFPGLAGSYGLDDNWQVQTLNKEVLFFNNSKSCEGSDCPEVFPRFTSNDPDSWDVEPKNNQCIDRWKKYPWDDYIGGLQALCQSSPVYIAAVESAAQQDANDDLIAQCIGNDLCDDLVGSIKAVLSNSYFLSLLKTKLAEYETAINEAKKARESYLIPFSDPAMVTIDNDHYLISRLNDFEGNLGIISHIKALRSGYSSLIEIHKATKGDWNSTLNDRAMTGITMPKGFQSPEELLATIESYEKVLGLEAFKGEGLNEISKPVISKLSCSWEVKGRIRKFSDLKIKSVAKEAYKGFRVETKLQSIAPIVIE